MPDGWDEDGEPISWTPYVMANLATAYETGLPNDYIWQNRWAGQVIDYPAALPTDANTKGEIVTFLESYLIPFHSSWTKAILLQRLSEFVK
ncbi:unnamed protein product [marine sediment metagenome]|uniref:Uncharacterized protein n=1 Tax=marine sediment metagenome TaxID=412755 RepID=X1CW04_9ZZZZ